MRAEGYAVESICAVLREQGVQVAARTYRAWKKRLPALRTIEETTPQPGTDLKEESWALG